MAVFTVIICACASSGSSVETDNYGQENYKQNGNRINYKDNYEPPLPTYQIGDYGPAGGIIFYDKRNNSGGWRYLEAALVDAEFQAAWSVNRTFVGNTKIVIGSGRQNTQLLVNKFQQTEDANTAAQIVSVFNYGGFNDWFLPSQAELDQLYGNLKRKNLGGFKDELYWASDDANREGKTSVINFMDGTVSYSEKENIHYVRPVRQVPGPNPVGNNTVVYANSGGNSGSSSSFFSRNSNVIYTVLGIVIVGGIIAYMIWGPNLAGSTN